jgi:hypothetical protein
VQSYKEIARPRPDETPCIFYSPPAFATPREDGKSLSTDSPESSTSDGVSCSALLLLAAAKVIAAIAVEELSVIREAAAEIDRKVRSLMILH